LVISSDALALSYVNHFLAQFAGEIGTASFGLGKTFTRYSVAGLYGVVPHELSGSGVIETVTLRQTYRLYDWKRVSTHAGFNLFHVLGLTYQASKFKESPKGYYPIGSIRALVNFGASVALDKAHVKSFYLECGLNDIWITNWITNQDVINPWEHTSLALGFRHSF
jgi:hypothetical protein